MSGAFTLLNPGPINVHPRVREALAASVDQCHREREYLEMQTRVRAKIAQAFGVASDYDAVLVSGSGTAGMEMTVSSVIGSGVLVIDNGVYGARMAAMAAAHRIPHDVLKVDWLERPDPDAVRDALTDEHDTIAIVHHETTTGLLNDVPQIGRIARETGRKLIVDSVSGLAGEVFDFEAIRPTAVFCTANKCIEGLPGVSFALLRRGTELQQRSIYLDMGNQLAQQEAGGTPFTPAIQVTAAFETALDLLIEETVAGRIARYGHAARRIRKAFDELGLELLLPASLLSHTITCAKLPEGVTYEQIHERMRAERFVLYGGQGDLGKTAFRVANMGQISEERLDDFGPALKKAIS